MTATATAPATARVRSTAQIRENVETWARSASTSAETFYAMARSVPESMMVTMLAGGVSKAKAEQIAEAMGGALRGLADRMTEIDPQAKNVTGVIEMAKQAMKSAEASNSAPSGFKVVAR